MKQREAIGYLEKRGAITPVYDWKQYRTFLHQETGWRPSSKAAYEAQQQRRQNALKALIADEPIFRVSSSK